MNKQRERKYEDPRLNDAAEELWSYRELQKEIQRYEEKCQEYEDRCDVGAMRYDAVHVKGGLKDGLVNNICAWADLKTELDKKKLDAEHKLWIITQRLESLNLRQRQVLTLYYIKGYSMSKIAQMMSYSSQTIKLIKIKGLENYSKKVKD